MKFETGTIAGGKEGISGANGTKVNGTTAHGSGSAGKEGGVIYNVKYSIDKLEMKLNGLKLEMGGGEGMKGLAGGNLGSVSHSIHETMMKPYIKSQDEAAKNAYDKDESG